MINTREREEPKEGEPINQDALPRYTGKIRNCLRDGKGTYKFPHGGNDFFVYDGPWTKGTRQGVNAHFTVTGHSEYSGEFSGGEISGFGKRAWADGRFYEGDFVNGEMHGRGKWANSNGSETYEGEFKDNKRHGFGIYQTPQDLYKGQFHYNQLHGPGHYLFNRQCYVSSIFQHNYMNGPTLIKWLKLGTLSCSMKDGYAEGPGYLFLEDGSYDFEGSWEAGYPSYPLIAKYIWCDIEKVPVVPVLDAKGKPIPPKGKPDANLGPIIVAGSNVGKVLIKTSPVSIASILAAAAATTAPVKGKPPPKPEEMKLVLPEPDIYAVPCERARRVVLSVRKIKQAAEELTDDCLEDPIPLWLRNKSLSEYGSERFRFPPSCTLFIDGDCAGYGSTFSSAPALVVENSVQESSAASSIIVPASSQPDEMAALKLSKGMHIRYQLPLQELKKSYESMTYVVDFKIDVFTLANTFRSALQQSRLPGATVGSTGKSFRVGSSAAAGSKRGSSHRLSSGASGAGNLKQFIELPVLTLNRSFDGTELTGSKLVLVLIVPDANLKRMAKKIAKLNKEAGAGAGEDTGVGAAGNANVVGSKSTSNTLQPSMSMQSLDSNANSKSSLPEAPTLPTIGGDLVDIDWTECIWELRLCSAPATTALSTSQSGTSLPSSNDAPDVHHVNTNEHPPPLSNSNSQLSLDIPRSASQSHFGACAASGNLQTTICGRWREGAFSCAQWHSIALTLRSNHHQQDLDFDGFLGGSSTVVSFIVDGSGRIRAPVDIATMTTSNSGAISRPISMQTSVPSTPIQSVPSELLNSPGRANAFSAHDINDGVLLAWLPEKPGTNDLEQSPSQDMGPIPDGLSPKQSQASDFSVIIRVGGDQFVGFIKCIATCSEGDRADPVKMTECYETWRKQERAVVSDAPATEATVENAAPVSNERVEMPPAPSGHVNAVHVPLHLVCGSTDIERIVIPSYTTEGDYVVEIRDDVNSLVLTDEAPIPVPLQSEEPSAPSAPLAGNKAASMNKSQMNMAAVTEPPLEDQRPVVIPRKPRDNYTVRDKSQFVTSIPVSRRLRIKVTKS